MTLKVALFCSVNILIIYQNPQLTASWNINEFWRQGILINPSNETFGFTPECLSTLIKPALLCRKCRCCRCSPSGNSGIQMSQQYLKLIDISTLFKSRYQIAYKINVPCDLNHRGQQRNKFIRIILLVY